VARVVVKAASSSKLKGKVKKASLKKVIKPPTPHRSSVRPPKLDPKQIPHHVAIVMDGNGRWAKQRGLPRTAGHEAGELALVDIVHGAIEIGVKELSVYAFSTENWRRSPEEVKFLMGFNRQVIHNRRDELNELGIKIRWVGRQKKLWASVIKELTDAENLTKNNKVLTLNMCINYGGRAEVLDAAVAIAKDALRKKVKPDLLTEKSIAKYLYAPDMSDVDLFLRSSGEQRTSNFLMWQSAYAEMVFMDVLWPDADRRTLWRAIEIYAERERRFGKA
jgi:undecaprenyl diphosphate synthase